MLFFGGDSGQDQGRGAKQQQNPEQKVWQWFKVWWYDCFFFFLPSRTAAQDQPLSRELDLLNYLPSEETATEPKKEGIGHLKGSQNLLNFHSRRKMCWKQERDRSSKWMFNDKRRLTAACKMVKIQQILAGGLENWLNIFCTHTQKNAITFQGNKSDSQRGINEESVTKCFHRQDKNRADLIIRPSSSQWSFKSQMRKMIAEGSAVPFPMTK